MRRIVFLLLTALLLASCAGQTRLIDIEPTDPPEGLSATPTPTPKPTPAETPAPPEPTEKPPPDFEVEEYNGPLYHVFTHFLIAFPDIARNNSYGRNLDADCITPTEFRRSLEEFYKNGFVLMNLNDYVEIAEDGTVTRKPIMVPVGKKPLILSFDDINYYSGNLGKGICDKVVLDADGKLAMSTMQNGVELITYENCVIPVLEAFCEEFPGFSPFGDKGLLSITGYDGILGYRTHSGSPNRESEIKAVKPVVQALLDAGWYFASHGYGHYDMEKLTLQRTKEDTQKWIDEVASIVGDCKIYIFPYGSRTKWDDARFLSLIDKGFPLLMGVGISPVGHAPYVRHKDEYFFMDRWTIDGNALRLHADRLAPVLDAKVVFCPEERG
jgi:hypothetical protein